MKLESGIESTLKTAVKAAKGLCIKLPSGLYRGIPDRLVLLPGGRIWFIELKRTKGSPTTVHQLKFRKTLRRLGFASIYISGMDQLKDWINEHC